MSRKLFGRGPLFGNVRHIIINGLIKVAFRKSSLLHAGTFIGSFGTILRNQGTAILLNIKFGPKVNAAYGIANQVSSQANQLAVAMLCAFSPEITASERGVEIENACWIWPSEPVNLERFLFCFLTVPLVIEMDYILKLWLVEPPAHSALFCRLILITFLIERLTSGYMAAVNAHGRIAAYQATVWICMLLTLPLAWFFLKIGAPPTSVGIAFYHHNDYDFSWTCVLGAKVAEGACQ